MARRKRGPACPICGHEKTYETTGTVETRYAGNSVTIKNVPGVTCPECCKAVVLREIEPDLNALAARYKSGRVDYYAMHRKHRYPNWIPHALVAEYGSKTHPDNRRRIFNRLTQSTEQQKIMWRRLRLKATTRGNIVGFGHRFIEACFQATLYDKTSPHDRNDLIQQMIKDIKKLSLQVRSRWRQTPVYSLFEEKHAEALARRLTHKTFEELAEDCGGGVNNYLEWLKRAAPRNPCLEDVLDRFVERLEEQIALPPVIPKPASAQGQRNFFVAVLGASLRVEYGESLPSIIMTAGQALLPESNFRADTVKRILKTTAKDFVNYKVAPRE